MRDDKMSGDYKKLQVLTAFAFHFCTNFKLRLTPRPLARRASTSAGPWITLRAQQPRCPIPSTIPRNHWSFSSLKLSVETGSPISNIQWSGQLCTIYGLSPHYTVISRNADTKNSLIVFGSPIRR